MYVTSVKILILRTSHCIDGEDYNGTEITVTIPARAWSQAFTISILDDEIKEGDESFTVEIVSVSACGVSLDSILNSEVTIIDNEGVHMNIYMYVAMYLWMSQLLTYSYVCVDHGKST